MHQQWCAFHARRLYVPVCLELSHFQATHPMFQQMSTKHEYVPVSNEPRSGFNRLKYQRDDSTMLATHLFAIYLHQQLYFCRATSELPCILYINIYHISTVAFAGNVFPHISRQNMPVFISGTKDILTCQHLCRTSSVAVIWWPHEQVLQPGNPDMGLWGREKKPVLKFLKVIDSAFAERTKYCDFYSTFFHRCYTS